MSEIDTGEIGMGEISADEGLQNGRKCPWIFHSILFLRLQEGEVSRLLLVTSEIKESTW